MAQLRVKLKQSIDNERAHKGRRNLVEYPNHKNLIKTEQRLTYDQEIDKNMFVQREERPTVLRANIVEKYLHQILNKKKDPVIYEKKY